MIPTSTLMTATLLVGGRGHAGNDEHVVMDRFDVTGADSNSTREPCMGDMWPFVDGSWQSPTFVFDHLSSGRVKG